MPTGLINVEWSPDANYILFVTSDSELHVYDLLGTFAARDRLSHVFRGGAAAATWMFRGRRLAAAPRPRRGYARGRRDAATPRPRRGYAAEKRRGDAAAATRICSWETSRGDAAAARCPRDDAEIRKRPARASAGTKVKVVPTIPGDEARRKGRERARIIALHWYDGLEGYADPTAPTLAVAFADGRVQLLRGVDDADPILLESGLRLRECRWNTRGTALALAGAARADRPDAKEDSVVQFYSPLGKKLRTLKVPGGGINALSWEGGGLRIALAVDARARRADRRTTPRPLTRIRLWATSRRGP